MPSIAHEKKQFYKSRIRSLLSVDHQMTNAELQAKLDGENIHLDRGFLAKLLKDVYRERMTRADRVTLNHALAAFEDTMTEVVRVAWSIATDPFARNQDRVMALREVREAHNMVFEKLFDAGVFDRKLGTLDTMIRNTLLPEDRKQAIRIGFENWGLIEAPKEDDRLAAKLLLHYVRIDDEHPRVIPIDT